MVYKDAGTSTNPKNESNIVGGYLGRATDMMSPLLSSLTRISPTTYWCTGGGFRGEPNLDVPFWVGDPITGAGRSL